MYRHLLVPVDGTDLSTQVVGQAVEFARVLGARITFFPCGAGPLGVADAVRRKSSGRRRRTTIVYAFEGRARELLAKAEAAARAQGVPCSTASSVSDQPYEAHPRRCARCRLRPDLHGVARTAQQRRHDARLADAEGSDADRDSGAGRGDKQSGGTPARAIGIIRDEHRSLAAVLHAWMHLIATARAATANAAGSRADARDRPLHPRLSGRAASSKGRRLPVPQAARAHIGGRCRARRARAAARARPTTRRRTRRSLVDNETRPTRPCSKPRSSAMPTSSGNTSAARKA